MSQNLFYSCNDMLKNMNLIELKKINMIDSVKDPKKYILSERNIIKQLKSLAQLANLTTNNEFGTIIAPHNLMSAWASGSLFIRKCMNNSKINCYSQLINELEK